VIVSTCQRILRRYLTEREERSAVAIVGNEPFSGWTKTFTRLCAAIVDRLTSPADRRNRRHQLLACPGPWPALGEAGSTAG